MSDHPERPSGSNATTIVLVIVAIAGGMLFLCCGGATVLYLSVAPSLDRFGEGISQGVQQGLSEGLDEFDRQVQVEVEDHPVIVEHIGAIQEFSHDWDASMDEPGEDVSFAARKGAVACGPNASLSTPIRKTFPRASWCSTAERRSSCSRTIRCGEMDV